MRQIVFDLETTGFRFDEGHRIVEIGGVELVRGAITGKSFHAYVNPQRDVPKGAFDVHGLSYAFLKDFPTFSDPSVAQAFLEFVGDAELIAHNGKSFDLPFLNDELTAAGMAKLSNQLVDTLHLARRRFPGAPASLDALCARFGVDTAARERDGHGALLDSRLLAEVYIELTGGAQAGLDLDAAEERAIRDRSRGPARKRPGDRPRLVTPAEAAAHAAFIAELGDAAIWRRFETELAPRAHAAE
ncbi:MAG: DNA polymerase III subunit epsilon [Alphaproteobacteria bacterium]|nr:DNA polymerase III subunit epsilon [Alphaproteobacteria bacterium]